MNKLWFYQQSHTAVLTQTNDIIKKLVLNEIVHIHLFNYINYPRAMKYAAKGPFKNDVSGVGIRGTQNKSKK